MQVCPDIGFGWRSALVVVSTAVIVACVVDPVLERTDDTGSMRDTAPSDRPRADACPVVPCLDDTHCSPSDHCLSGDFVRDGPDCRDFSSVCVERGVGVEGDACEGYSDCRSGVCGGFACLQTCRRNADCEEGENCSRLYSSHFRCVPDELASCRERLCQGADSRCGHVFCMERPCRTTGDCPDADCLRTPSAPGEGHCGSEPAACRPDELRLDDITHATCFLPVFCAADDDCPAGYRCRSTVTPSTLPRPSAYGLCART